jgi:hypothetical protein
LRRAYGLRQINQLGTILCPSRETETKIRLPK